MLIETNFIPRPYSAITIWPFIFIKPAYSNDHALLMHEITHYDEQRWITPWWWAKYIFSTRFRIAAEVRAYQVQIIMGFPLESAAAWLCTYDRKLTKETARALLLAK